MKTTIAITGSSGYLGRCLVRKLESTYNIIQLTRQPHHAEDYTFSLSHIDNLECLKNADILIHCAWDLRSTTPKDIMETNILGSKKLVEKAMEHGVKRILFISSISAYENCPSLYGQSKLAVEKILNDINNSISIRLGLIYSETPGGIVKTLLKLQNMFPIIPMIGFGTHQLYPIHEKDVVTIIEHCITSQQTLPSVITVAQEQSMSLRDILKALNPKKTLRYIPIPWQLIWIGLKLCELVGFKIRLKSDNLISLLRQNPAPDFNPLRTLNIRYKTLTLNDKKQ